MIAGDVARRICLRRLACASDHLRVGDDFNERLTVIRERVDELRDLRDAFADRYPRSAVIRVILSSTVSGDSFEEAVEECLAVGLVVVAGVVALAEDDGYELGSGLEVGAGLAG